MLGLTEMGTDVLTDSRQGGNKQHLLIPLLRQSIYSRLAGYEDVNDAERVWMRESNELTGGNVAGEGVLRAEGDLEAAVASLTGQSRASNRLSAKKMPETSPGVRRGGGRAMLR